jgi:serine/threonine protein kinase/tetratricopeptide (TPR) repeat protein
MSPPPAPYSPNLPPRPPRPNTPALSAERAARAEATFTSALERSADQRAAFVAEACDGDEDLQARVHDLLAAHERADGFLEVAAPASAEVEAELARLKPEESGETIGPYKLREQIGEGGFGTVWVADQEIPVRRRVALKILKLGMDTKEVIARFEQERQALAMMDHPNIARVLDAGATEHGRPYFVMELVRGVKITDYCDDQKLSTNERIGLFITVCQAVQHAHQKGIIHRDLKPSNILVTINDGEAVPKVIDFGVAKATQGRLSQRTIYTQFQQMIGTPVYMSPEQAEMTSLDIDTRSDIYSLGVLLYELLTGHTPIDQDTLARLGLDEIRRIIREVDPPRPSLRVKTFDGAEMTTAAKRRHTEPAKLPGTLRGDLDWIVMKCLEKDRKRRYDTANGLALDLHRHLENEVVVARPPTTAYLLSKLIKRNKSATVAGCTIAVALVIGFAVCAWQAVRAKRAESEATRTRDDAKAINQFLYDDLLAQATPDENAREKMVTMEAVLERAARRLDQNANITHRPEVEATLRYDIGSTYLKLGQLIEANRHLTRSVTLRRKTLGPQHRDTLLAQLQLSSAFLASNTYTDESETIARETAGGLKKLVELPDGRVPSSALQRSALDAEANYAWQLANRGQLETAIGIKRENVAAFEKTFGPDDSDVLSERSNLARLLSMRGDYAEAASIAQETLDRYRQKGQLDKSDAMMTASNLGFYLLLRGEATESERVLREVHSRAEGVLGANAPGTLITQLRLARAMEEQGNMAAAGELLERTLNAQRSTMDPNDGNVAISKLVLGRIMVKRGRTREAEALLNEARAVFREKYPFKPQFGAQAENWLGAIMQLQSLPESGHFLLPGVEQFFVRTAEMSPNERREAVAHVIDFYKAQNNPREAAALQNRWERFSNEREGTAGVK